MHSWRNTLYTIFKILIAVAIIATSVYVFVIDAKIGTSIATKNAEKGKKAFFIDTPLLSNEGLAVYNGEKSQYIDNVFKSKNYTLENITQKKIPVPALQSTKIPSDLYDQRTVQEGKELFIKILLPLIVHANSELAKKNVLLKDIKAQYKTNNELNPKNTLILQKLSNEFRIQKQDIPIKNIIAELEKRIQTVPNALILAKVISESLSGTAQFTLENNIFFDYQYEALLQEKQDDSALPSLQKSDKIKSPYDSIYQYIMRVNADDAYKKFRDYRYNLYRKNKKITGTQFVRKVASSTSELYSLRRVILRNNLLVFNSITISYN